MSGAKIMAKTEILKRHYKVCLMDSHDVDEHPEYFGDGTMSISVNGICKKCKLKIQFFWTVKYFSYAVVEPETDFCLVERIFNYPTRPKESSGHW